MTATIRETHRALTVGAIALASAVLFHSSTAKAQLIAVKTVPIADGEQFSFFPSANLGMGGVSLAIRDSIHDLFVNPAKGGMRGPAGRSGRSYFFGAPTFFSVSSRAGSGSTFPAGVVARSGSSFAAAAIAIQSVTDGRRAFAPGGFSVLQDGSGETGTNESHTNRYGFVLLGHTFGASKLSVGASALWSALGAIDGVNLLYTSSRSVRQSGGGADLRLGVLKEWNGGHSFEALLLRRHANMSNDVTYVDLFWDPIRRQTIERPRLEYDGERTRTSGIHLGYQRALADSAWRIGAIITANRVNHLNTPQYEIASVPSDRGRSSAMNLGLGLARTQGGATLGIDAIYEPIWSRLSVVADSETTPGTSIRTGETAVDNRLRFSNALLRVGLSQDLDLESQTTSLRLQLGMQARSVYYTVDQRDLVSGSTRKGGDDWMEWTRSWGVVLRRPAFEVRYAGRLTSGAGRPGVAGGGGDAVPPRPGVDLISAPAVAPPMTMNKVSVTMHQLSVSLPMR